MAKSIPILHRVVNGGSIEGVSEEGIKVVIKALGDELDFTAFYRHHQRGDTCIGDGINVCIVVIVQDSESAEVTSTASEVQRCATQIIPLVHIRLESHYQTKFLISAIAGCMHEQVDPTVHDWLVDWESMLYNVYYGFHLFLIDGLHDNHFSFLEGLGCWRFYHYVFLFKKILVKI